MKRIIQFFVLAVFGLALSAGCATMQTWPDEERSAENKMIVIQEKIGEGLKTGTLSPDQSQTFLTTLKGIRTDYTELRDKRISREQWDNLHTRLDALGEEINRTLSRTTKIENTWTGDRMNTLQKRIDDRRRSGRLSQTDAIAFQARIDSIRSEYLRMTQDGKYNTPEEKADISRRLDSLETDLNRYQ
jgi:hypothetical protein